MLVKKIKSKYPFRVPELEKVSIRSYAAMAKQLLDQYLPSFKVN